MVRKNKRVYGRKFKADKRDYSLKKLRVSRTSRFWRDDRWRGDQGYTPECVGFASAHLLSTRPHVQWLNPHGIYSLAQYLDEWSGENYDGTSVRAAMKVLQLLGFIDVYGFAFNVLQVRDYILENGPVVLGISWLEGMENPDKDAVIHATGRDLGGHAILATGYKRGKFRLLQSWGPSWGDKGHCWLSLHDLDKLLTMDGEAVTPTERKLVIPKKK